MGEDGGTDPEEVKRLKSFLLQLWTESGILDRMTYKNKNQHRRCLYFQFLLKVRRDVRLLLSMGLHEILRSACQVIHGNNPAQRIYLLERLKERHSSGRHNFQQRLLGVARLLSQMVEPIIRAAIQISSLLARSFFMAFSLTILSLLARLRVLVQQMLVDTVSVFNKVSSVSGKRLTVKLIKNGVEAFREYYPPSWELTSLDCLWQGDKFMLLESTHASRRREPEEDLGVTSLEATEIQYDRLEASDEDHEGYLGKMHKDLVSGEPAIPLATRHAPDACADTGGANLSDCVDEESNIERGPSPGTANEVEPHTTGVSSSRRRRYDSSKTRKTAAFIPVKVSTSKTTQIRPEKRMKLDDALGSGPLGTDRTEDSFFNLLTAGSRKSSLLD